MNCAQRVTTAPDGTRHMDPIDLLATYIDRYDLHDALDEEPLAVVRDWSEFCGGEALTPSLFAAAVTGSEGWGQPDNERPRFVIAVTRRGGLPNWIRS